LSLVVRSAEAGRLTESPAVIGLPVLAHPDGPRPFEAMAAFDLGVELPTALDPGWCKREGFSAKVGSSLVVRTLNRTPTLVLVGLGDLAGLDAERWRRAGAAFVRAGGEGGLGVFAMPPEPVGGPVVADALVQGALMAAYRFDQFRSVPKAGPLDEFTVLGAGLEAGVARGARIAQAVCTARDLINTPAGDLTPPRLAERFEDLLAGRPGVSIEIWDEERIRQERLGGLLGVSAGSAEPPRLVRVEYQPSATTGPRPAHFALCGKGITFDSGGLSLKTAEGMMTMKTDMSGAAIVMSVVAACADLQAPVRLSAFAPITENMPGGRAFRPGDVLRIRNGSTIEVLNTDAEGRLVLADALSLAAELQPDFIVDVATLTGAVRVALGNSVAGLLGNDETFLERIKEAGRQAGEAFWVLPLPDDYADHIDSDVADMKNTGKTGQAGAISAALLLQRFVGTIPWAHFDIAGTGRATESTGYLTKGATAFSVRTLIELFTSIDPA
jgi:leucyl aminopeptidase